MSDFKFDPMALNQNEPEMESEVGESLTFKPEALKPNLTAPIEDAIHVNPDDHAKNLRLSTESGLPTATVEQDQKAVENQVKSQAIRKSLDKHKFTATWMAEEGNARLAHDDVENLTALEAIANAWDRGILRIRQGGHQFMAEESAEQFQDVSRSFGEIRREQSPHGSFVSDPLTLLAASERWATSRLFGGAEQSAKRSMEGVAQTAQEMQEKVKSAPATRSLEAVMKGGQEDGFIGALRAVAADPVGAMALSAEIGIEFAPQLLVGGAVTMATGPAGGAATMGMLSGMTERYASPVEYLSSQGIDLNEPGAIEKVINDPVLMAKAKEFGFTRGAIIGAVDAISGGIASKTFGGPLRTMTTQMGIQAGMGGGGEATAQLATTGEIDAGEVVLEALGEFAMAPIEVVGVGGQYIGDLKQSYRAKRFAESLKEMNAIESNLRERSPEKYAEFKGKILRENGVEQISISGEGFAEFNQSGGDTSWIESLGLSEEGKLELYEAMDGDIELTPEQYAMLPPEVVDALAKHTRINDGMTEAEAEVFDESGLQDEFERISETFQALDPEEQYDVQLIQQKIEDQLQAAGESSETSSYYGILMAQRYMTRAQRSGQNALELYMKDNLNITQDEQMRQAVDDLTVKLDRARSEKSKEDQLKLEKQPVVRGVIASHGGIDPEGRFAGELKAKGVTRARVPGLFKKGGATDADNFIRSEFPFFAGQQEDADLNSYIDPDELIEAITREAFGEANRTQSEMTELEDFDVGVEDFNLQMRDAGMDINVNTDEEIRAAIEGKVFEQFTPTEEINITKEDPIFSIPQKELKNKEIKVQDEDGAEHSIKAKKAITIMRRKHNQVNAIVDCVNAG